MNAKPDVTVVVNAHREGLIAAATFKSLRRARLYAEARGYRVETIVCLDKCDALTREMVHGCAGSDARIFEVEFGDLGLSRNFSVQKAQGHYVSLLDADDLYGENWLALAIRAAQQDSRAIVWHSEVNLYFGAEPHIFCHVDMEDADFDPCCLISGNPWTALCFAERRVFERFPYPKTNLSLGIGYEDWGWNRQVISAGFLHKTVGGTGHAIRRKAVSLVQQTKAAGAFPAGTDLFRRMLEERGKARQVRQAIEPAGSFSSAALAARPMRDGAGTKADLAASR